VKAVHNDILSEKEGTSSPLLSASEFDAEHERLSSASDSISLTLGIVRSYCNVRNCRGEEFPRRIGELPSSE
jgi:hypothetical protein